LEQAEGSFRRPQRLTARRGGGDAEKQPKYPKEKVSGMQGLWAVGSVMRKKEGIWCDGRR